MRKTLTLLAVLALVALPALAQAPAHDDLTAPEASVNAPGAPAPPATVAPECDGQEGPESAIETPPIDGTLGAVTLSYPSCFTVAGTRCSPGTLKWCQWTEFEPELCWCPGDDPVWHCGNLS